MKTKTIENILNFLYEKEGKEFPQNWNLIKNLETHPDGTQYWYEGDLDLAGSTIRKLPNDLYVDGGLYLNRCQYLTELPNYLHVEGFLNLFNCNRLTKLPDNLYVDGYLSLFGTNIAELPNNLYVGWNLYIENTSLADKYTDEQIRDIVTSTGGEIVGKIDRQ